MESNFEQAVEWLLIDETGVEGRKLNPDYESLLTSGARKWLKYNYWLPLYCEGLNPGLDYLVFDLGFRFSPKLVKRWMGKLTHRRTMDLVIRDFNAARGVVMLEKLDGLSRRYLQSLPAWELFSSQWTNRSNRVLKRASIMARRGIYVSVA